MVLQVTKDKQQERRFKHSSFSERNAETCSIYFYNYAQGKTDTETNFVNVVTVGFTTKVNHQTTSKIWYRRFHDQGRETDRNNEICLGVRFALCIIKALRLARIEHCSGTVVNRFQVLHSLYIFTT